jgi:hypothetical protein
LDLSKAFDSVDHTLLLDKISASPLKSYLVLWLAAWLRGRSVSCLFRSAVSRKKLIKTDTPQGSVLSPDLYNFYVNDFPAPSPRVVPEKSVSESFADDFGVGESFPVLPTRTAALNNDMVQVAKWAADKNVMIAPEKSGIILFTPDPAQFRLHPLVYFNGILIPLKMVLRTTRLYHLKKI